MSELPQRSFAGGEITPELGARVDLVKYQTGLRKCRNYIVSKAGSVSNRPGNAFCCETKYPTRAVRLIEWIYSQDVSYILEFGHQYMRVLNSDGSLATLTFNSSALPFDISSISFGANTIVTTANAHEMSTGDSVILRWYSGGEPHMLRDRQFKVQVISANSYYLKYMDNTTHVNTVGAPALPSGIGTASPVQEIATPYSESDLAALQVAQLADSMWIAHRSYAMRKLTRSGPVYGNMVWTLSVAPITPEIDRPQNLSATGGSAGTISIKYKVTGVDNNGGETYPGYGVQVPIAIISNTNPVRVNSTLGGDSAVLSAAYGVPGGQHDYKAAGLVDIGYGQSATVLTANLGGWNPGCVITAYFREYRPFTGWTAWSVYPGIAAGNLPSGTYINTNRYHLKAQLQLRVTTFLAGGTASSTYGAGGQHLLASGDEVYIENCAAATYLNNRRFVVNVIDDYQFDLVGEDGTGKPADTSGDFKPLQVTIDNVLPVDPATPATYITISCGLGNEIPDAAYYNFYKSVNGIYGWIGRTQGNYCTLIDEGAPPDFAGGPPIEEDVLLNSTNNYPGAVGIYQQRLVVGSTNLEPERIWTSRIDAYDNFLKSFPQSDEDRIEFVAAGNQINQVRHIADTGALAVLTDGGLMAVLGDSNGAITPYTQNIRRQSGFGSSFVRPLVIGNDALYVHSKSTMVRDVEFDGSAQTFSETEISIFASHLFRGKQIIDWCYQHMPSSVVWCVLNDGTMAALTYIREHQLLAWHRHDVSNGFVENVASIPSSTGNALFLAVRRNIDQLASIGGSERVYIERQLDRSDDAIDGTFVDSSLAYDGTISDGTKGTLTGGTSWLAGEHLTLTSTTSKFKTYDAGNVYAIQGSDGTVLRCTVVSYTSGLVVTVTTDKDVPASMQATACDMIYKAVDDISGLWHLEGLDVSIIADGKVAASPNNPDYDDVTVTNGSVVLDVPAYRIRIGLPITHDIETLDIETAGANTLANKPKMVNQVILTLLNTLGGFAGTSEPDDDGVDGLDEIKFREPEDGYSAMSPKNIVKTPTLNGTWNRPGHIFLRHIDPTPCTILAIAPSGFLPARTQ